MDAPDLPYGVLVPLAIQFIKLGVELWRQRRSKSPRPTPVAISSPRSKEATVSKYLVLGTDGSQRWRLPTDTDVRRLRETIREAVEEGRSISVPIMDGSVESELVLPCSKIRAFTVLEDRKAIGL